MPRVANKLSTNRDGTFSGRKRIPEDVREAYARLWRTRWEERFSSGRVPFELARQKHREWLSEIEARITNIAQCFLKFAKANGGGPLFYREDKMPPANTDATNPPKPRYAKVRERIAEWVRKLGITDREVKPITHGGAPSSRAASETGSASACLTRSRDTRRSQSGEATVRLHSRTRQQA